jgi:5'-3' exonuclease
MNQQRSRRFRSAKEAEVAAAERLARGEADSGSADKSVTFDSNCITPGTDFMLKLSIALQKWVRFKLDTDEAWKNGADVIVSGPDVPGEGEHKVMDFIRQEKAKPNSKYYRPGMVHVLYGTYY